MLELSQVLFNSLWPGCNQSLWYLGIIYCFVRKQPWTDWPLNIYKLRQKKVLPLHMMQLLFLDMEKLKTKSLLQLQIALKREKKSLAYQQDKPFIRA